MESELTLPIFKEYLTSFSVWKPKKNTKEVASDLPSIVSDYITKPLTKEMVNNITLKYFK